MNAAAFLVYLVLALGSWTALEWVYTKGRSDRLFGGVLIGIAFSSVVDKLDRLVPWLWSLL